MPVLRSIRLLSGFCDDPTENGSMCSRGLGSVVECQTVQSVAQAGVWSIPHKNLFDHSEQNCATVWLKLSLFSGGGRTNGASSLTDLPESFPSLPNAKKGFLLVCDGRKMTLSCTIEGNGTSLHKCTSGGVQKEAWRKLNCIERRVSNRNLSDHWQRWACFRAGKGNGEHTPSFARPAVLIYPQ